MGYIAGALGTLILTYLFPPAVRYFEGRTEAEGAICAGVIRLTVAFVWPFTIGLVVLFGVCYFLGNYPSKNQRRSLNHIDHKEMNTLPPDELALRICEEPESFSPRAVDWAIDHLPNNDGNTDPIFLRQLLLEKGRR